MKLENAPTNKAKFFALYYGQDLAVIYKASYTHPKGLQHVVSTDVINSVKSESFVKHKYTLLLTPLSQITDKDKEYLGVSGSHSCDEFGYWYGVDDHSWSSSDVDYLRSKGYALPWMGLSVETLVEYSWVKLKEVTPC